MISSIQSDLEVLKQRNVDKQEPFAAVLSCADSRVVRVGDNPDTGGRFQIRAFQGSKQKFGS